MKQQKAFTKDNQEKNAGEEREMDSRMFRRGGRREEWSKSGSHGQTTLIRSAKMKTKNKTATKSGGEKGTYDLTVYKGMR